MLSTSACTPSPSLQAGWGPVVKAGNAERLENLGSYTGSKLAPQSGADDEGSCYNPKDKKAPGVQGHPPGV